MDLQREWQSQQYVSCPLWIFPTVCSLCCPGFHQEVSARLSSIQQQQGIFCLDRSGQENTQRNKKDEAFTDPFCVLAWLFCCQGLRKSGFRRSRVRRRSPVPCVLLEPILE